MAKRKNLILTNIVLAAVALLLVNVFRNQWNQFRATHNLTVLNPRPESVLSSSAAAAKPIQVTSYIAIVDNNLFSADRNNVVPLDPLPSAANKPKPKPVLTGILGFGGQDLALMLPAEAKDSREYRQVRVGESIDGYTLVKFLDQKVLMSIDGAEVEIPISEPTKLVAREYVMPATTQTGSGAASPGRVTQVDAGTDASRSTAGDLSRSAPPPPRESAPVDASVNGKVKKSIPSPFGPMTIWVEDRKK